jgi:hypothetical protein
MGILVDPPSVGQGIPGFIADMRPYAELIDLSSFRSDAILEIDGAAVVEPGDWQVESGGAYDAPWLKQPFGVLLDVVAVRTPTEFLTRKATKAEVRSTPGTFYYRPKDSFPVVLVHLAGSADPAATLVSLTTTRYFSSGGAIVPLLGPQLVTNGNLEDGFTGWTEDKSGSGWATARTTVNPIEGQRSLECSSSGAAAGYASRYQVLPTIAGGAGAPPRMYRTAVWYRSPVGQPASAHAYVRVGTTTTLKRDGRTAEASLTDGLELPRTGGRDRLSCFDYYAHEDNARLWFRLVNGSAVACSFLFDEIRTWEILGWYYADPRLPEDGLPETTQGSQSPVPGANRIGGGVVKLVAGGGPAASQKLGYLEQLFAPQPWVTTRKEIRARSGGVFPDGREILYHDMFQGYSGIISGGNILTLDRGYLTLSTLDPQAVLSVSILRRAYDTGTFPQLAKQDEGLYRPFVLGAMPGFMRPAGIAKITATSYRKYEWSDPTDWAVGFQSVDEVRAYPTAADADAENPVASYLLVAGKDYTVDLVAGTIDVIADVQMFEITPERNIINLTIHTVGTYRIIIPPGWYTLGYGGSTVADRRGLMDTIRGLVATASGLSVIEWTYSQTTHLVSFTAGAKLTVTLHTATGADKHISILPFLGFDSAADVGPVITATSTTPMFKPTVAGVPSDDADNRHHLRLRASGAKDDADGTYTGVPVNLIENGPDQFRFVHGALLQKPPSRINEASFLQARTDCPQAQSRVFFGKAAEGGGASMSATMQGWINELQIGTQADIVLDGHGAFHYRKRSNAVTGKEVRIYNRDCLDVKSVVPDDQDATVILTYAQSPATGRTKSVQVTNALTALLYESDGVFAVHTCLVDLADAESARDFIAALRRAGIRRFELEVAGKLLMSMVSDNSYLTLDQVLLGTAEGVGVEDELFRLEGLSKNWVTGICRAAYRTNILS